MTRSVTINRSLEDRSIYLERSGRNSPRYPELSFDNNFTFAKRTKRFVKAYVIPGPPPKVPAGSIFTIPPITNGQVTWGSAATNAEFIPVSEAILKLRNNINSYDFNGLVTAMEMRSTIEGIGRRAQILGRAYRSLRHGDLKGMINHLDLSDRHKRRKFPKASTVRDNAAKHLLEYQFGYVTLVNDMVNLGTAIYDQSQKERYEIVKGVYTSSVSYKQHNTSMKARYVDSKGTRYATDVGITVGKSSGKSRTIATAKCSVTNAALQPLSAFGFTNPFHALWQVAPMSWAIDGFYPVGSFLSQLYLPPGVKVSQGRICRFAERSCSVSGDTQKFDHLVRWRTPDGRSHSGYQQLTVHFMNGQEDSVAINAYPTNEIFSMKVPKPKLPFLGQAITLTAWASLQGQQLKAIFKKN